MFIFIAGVVLGAIPQYLKLVLLAGLPLPGGVGLVTRTMPAVINWCLDHTPDEGCRRSRGVSDWKYSDPILGAIHHPLVF
jgi:hypothetical protein